MNKTTVILAADFPAIRNDYSRETGRVKNLSE